jgi:hypothetical protein
VDGVARDAAANGGGQPQQILFEVPGWPPLKNEATSMLAVGHRQAERIEELLRQAAQAAAAAHWAPTTAEVAMEVIVRCPAARPPGDATNFLGGIADVLQDKTNPRNIDLSHLGDLQAVALYHDDRQISQINYRVARADSPSYIVRITVLPDLGAIGTDIQSHDGW